MSHASVALVVPPEDREFARAKVAPRSSGIPVFSAPRITSSAHWDRDLSLLLVRGDTLLDSPDSTAAIVEYFWNEAPEAPVIFYAPSRERSAARFQQLAFEFAAQRPPRASSYVARDLASVRRLVLAHKHDAEDQLIASAEYEAGVLKVWSCKPRLYRCPVEKLPALAALPEEHRGHFQVSESGSRIHWPHGDVDLDLPTIRAAVDPRFQELQRRAFRAEAGRYGTAIRTLREKRRLRQEDIPGLSARELRRLEKGEVFPHGGTVEKLAKAHRMSVTEYLAELASLSRREGPRRRPRRRRRA